MVLSVLLRHGTKVHKGTKEMVHNGTKEMVDEGTKEMVHQGKGKGAQRHKGNGAQRHKGNGAQRHEGAQRQEGPQAHKGKSGRGLEQVEDLARLSFKHKPIYVGIHDRQVAATREGLEQGYCIVPSDKRFLLLFTFLKKNLNRKVPLAFSTPNPNKWQSIGHVSS